MTIKYTNFSDGIHKFTLTEKAKKLGLENLFFGDVVVECKMDKSAHQIVLTCNLEANSQLICDRCNQEFKSKLNNEFVLSFIFTKSEHDSEDFNLRYLSPEQDKIDISKDVYEYAELAIPLKKLCSDNCKGLCPKCGTNLNEKKCNCKIEIDNDIWAPLQKLKNQFNN